MNLTKLITWPSLKLLHEFVKIDSWIWKLLEGVSSTVWIKHTCLFGGEGGPPPVAENLWQPPLQKKIRQIVLEGILYMDLSKLFFVFLATKLKFDRFVET